MSVKYSITFLILAMAFALVGLITLPVIVYSAVIFFYSAVSFLVVAAAYAGLGPRVFGKRTKGQLHPLNWIVLGPYLLLNMLSFWIYRHSSKKPAFVQVTPVLFFGRRLTPAEAITAKKMGWVGVLDLAAEFSEVRPLREDLRYRSLPILDGTAPTAEQLQNGMDWIKETIKAGPVYIHCALGHGRSVTLVMAYLLSTDAVKTVKEGMTLLRSLRAGIGLNPPQRNLLKHFFDSGYYAEGVKQKSPGQRPHRYTQFYERIDKLGLVGKRIVGILGRRPSRLTLRPPASVLKD